MLGLCRKNYLVDNSSNKSNCQCFFWITTEKKKYLLLLWWSLIHCIQGNFGQMMLFISMWFTQRKEPDWNDWCLTVLTFIRKSRQQNSLQSKLSKLINHCFWLNNQNPNKNLQWYVLRGKIIKSKAHNGIQQQGIKNN